MTTSLRSALGAAFAAALVAGVACAIPRRLPPCVAPAPDGGVVVAPGEDPVLLAAGDIVDVDLAGAQATARLLDLHVGQVATLGDNANTDGSLDDFLVGYETTWGRHRWRTRPAVGNHDYMTAHAAPYFAYFCSAAGTPFEGWYSYDLGAWHVVVLNSQCADRDRPEGPGCGVGSAQLAWLEDDLARHPSKCALAYWHHPRFASDAEGGDHAELTAVWKALHRAGAELVLSAHVHHYERFAPLDSGGALDAARGVRQFVVGTGGAELTGPPGHVRAHGEAQITGQFGVLRLVLRPEAYDWEFIAASGAVLDSGSAACH